MPKDKREFGFFVLPILHRDRLIGRVDSTMDRKASIYRVNAVFAEDGAPESAGPAVAKAIASSASGSARTRSRTRGGCPPSGETSLRN